MLSIFIIIVIFACISVRKAFKRTNAETKLKKFLQNNKIKFELKNKHIEMRLVDNIFYCKERTNGKKQGRFFYVLGDDGHVMTLWGLINAEFSEKSTYNNMRDFYRALSVRQRNARYGRVYELNPEDVYGLSRRIAMISNNANPYFHEDSLKYPDFIMNEAQNEYCRITLEQSNGKFYLLCKEIWGTKSFIIKCPYPEAILEDFKLMKNKMLDYSGLLKLYKYKEGLEIIFPEVPIKQEYTDNKANFKNAPQDDLPQEDLPQKDLPHEDLPRSKEREIDL